LPSDAFDYNPAIHEEANVRKLGIVLIMLAVIIAILKLAGIAGPDATTSLMLLALVLAGGGYMLYRRARRREAHDQA
jgi:hypothetical protein